MDPALISHTAFMPWQVGQGCSAASRGMDAVLHQPLRRLPTATAA